MRPARPAGHPQARSWHAGVRTLDGPPQLRARSATVRHLGHQRPARHRGLLARRVPDADRHLPAQSGLLGPDGRPVAVHPFRLRAPFATRFRDWSGALVHLLDPLVAVAAHSTRLEHGPRPAGRVRWVASGRRMSTVARVTAARTMHHSSVVACWWAHPGQGRHGRRAVGECPDCRAGCQASQS
jgi:hypothetical protein